MGIKLVVGLVMMMFCLVIQCLFVGVMLRILLLFEKRKLKKLTMIQASLVLILSMISLMIGNLLQVTLWAVLFYSIHEFTDFFTAFYHSIVNFTSLGYGDIVMSQENRVLGGLEALNGILMLGLTSGFLYMVLYALMKRAWDEKIHIQ